jgi:hypothetical protein
MKKIKWLSFTIALLAIVSCKKDSGHNVTSVSVSTNKTTIDYEFTANSAAEYNITFQDSLGASYDYIPMGTKWSKIVHPVYPSKFPAIMAFTRCYPFPSVSKARFQIIVNGVTKIDSTYNFDAGNFRTLIYTLP